MGTYGSIMLSGADRGRADEWASIAQNKLKELERAWSVFRSGSEVGRINAAAGDAPVPVSAVTRDAVAAAIRYGSLSGGAFDVTVGPLMKLWGFRSDVPPDQPPPPEAIRETLERVGFRRIVVGPNTVFLERPGMVLDLGGIAKGLAVDAVCEELRRRGARNFLVNLGGNIRVFGRVGPKRPWRVGVRDPFDREKLLGVLALESGEAVATSGNYERFVEIGGRRYAHILDPRTGRPVEGMAGVTVVARSAGEADAMSTALFVLGVERGREALRYVPGCHAVFIPDRRPAEAFVTGGLMRRMQPEIGWMLRMRSLDP